MKPQGLSFGQHVTGEVSRDNDYRLKDTVPEPVVHSFKTKGYFTVEHFRKGVLFRKYILKNGVTNIGKNEILDVMFSGLTAHPQITQWYIGLIQDGGYSALAAGDTMSSHAGWAEFTGYDETYRQEWGPGAAASQAITNATPAQYTINTGDTLKGIFVTTDNTISGSSGTLWATALFDADITVVSADVLKITYTVSAD